MVALGHRHLSGSLHTEADVNIGLIAVELLFRKSDIHAVYIHPGFLSQVIDHALTHRVSVLILVSAFTGGQAGDKNGNGSNSHLSIIPAVMSRLIIKACIVRTDCQQVGCYHVPVGMDNSAQNAPRGSGEPCPRCKQPISFQDSRCPNCGERLSGMARNLSLWIGVGGVGAILFVVLLMWLVVYNEDIQKAPVPVDEATAQKDILPEIPKEAAKEPPKPEKAPPLNQ
jgi:hypothetical protein